jgi:hypothetical protein
VEKAAVADSAEEPGHARKGFALLAYFALGVLCVYGMVLAAFVAFLPCSLPTNDSAYGIKRWSLVPPGPYCDFRNVGGEAGRASWWWTGLVVLFAGLLSTGSKLGPLPMRRKVLALVAGCTVPVVAVVVWALFEAY